MTSVLRIAFFGSGEFALPVVRRLASLGNDASLVQAEMVGLYTRPPRRAGRGKKIRPTPVAALAADLGLQVEAPESANSPETLAALASLELDFILVADYGEFLGKRFRELPRIGAFNLHGSLLPKHRGAAPVAYALLAGEQTTGVTLFRIERTLDSGPIVGKCALEIGPEETAGELETRLSEIAADLFMDTLPSVAAGTHEETPQDPAGVTLAPKLTKEEARMDWTQSAEKLTRATRAYNPWPGAYSFLARGSKAPERTTFLRLRPITDHGGQPGVVVRADKSGLIVACGNGAVEILEVQRAGKAPLPAVEFLRGSRLVVGDRFVTNPEATEPGAS